MSWKLQCIVNVSFLLPVCGSLPSLPGPLALVASLANCLTLQIQDEMRHYRVHAKSRTLVECLSSSVVGPVIERRASITYLSWIINERKLREEFELTSVVVFNDLVATAYFVLHLTSEKDVYSLNGGSPAMNGAQTPVHVVLTSRAAPLEAAKYGVRKIGENS
ncbi:MAG: glucokinase [Candidatus Bathyarchaeia archaeon]